MIIPIIVSARHIKTYTYEQLCFYKQGKLVIAIILKSSNIKSVIPYCL